MMSREWQKLLLSMPGGYHNCLRLIGQLFDIIADYKDETDPAIRQLLYNDFRVKRLELAVEGVPDRLILEMLRFFVKHKSRSMRAPSSLV